MTANNLKKLSIFVRLAFFNIMIGLEKYIHSQDHTHIYSEENVNAKPVPNVVVDVMMMNKLIC
jgi:preprotein translocase subunit SecG